MMTWCKGLAQGSVAASGARWNRLAAAPATARPILALRSPEMGPVGDEAGTAGAAVVTAAPGERLSGARVSGRYWPMRS